MLALLLELGYDPDEAGHVGGLEETVPTWGSPLRDATIRGSVEMEAPADKGRPVGATTSNAPAASASSGSGSGTSVAGPSPAAVSAPKHEPLARP